MSDLAARIAANLTDVRKRIAAAAVAAGRSPDDVRLVAVTKYVDDPIVRMLYDAGCRDFGESRPQQLWEKAAAIAERDIRWHLIGPLQRNKIRRTLPIASLIHSVDRAELIADLESEAARLGKVAASLLEVNVSGEAAKHGFAPLAMPALIEQLAACPHLQVRGLMCMAGLADDADSTRRRFAELRALRDRLRAAWGDRFPLDELSMGMSGDFEAAITEGATIVRVGSALFEE